MATETVVGKTCKLLCEVRDAQGKSRFNEEVVILKEVINLDRRMLLVKFLDGVTTFLFPHEIEIL